MLQGSKYSPLTLRAALKRYEPGAKNYIDIVSNRTGLDPERKICSLTLVEFKLFYEAIEFVEKWFISGVHKKRGTIFEYRIQKPPKALWIPKKEAIKLAEAHKLHVVIVHLKNGTVYLRSEYGMKRFILA